MKNKKPVKIKEIEKFPTYITSDFVIQGKKKLKFNENGISEPIGNKYVVLKSPFRQILLNLEQMDIILKKLQLFEKKVEFMNDAYPIVCISDGITGSNINIRISDTYRGITLPIESLKQLMENLAKIIKWWSNN